MADDSRSSRLAVWLAAAALAVALVSLAVALLRDDSTRATQGGSGRTETTTPYKVPKGSVVVGEKTITVSKNGPQVVNLGPVSDLDGVKSSAIAIIPVSKAVSITNRRPEWTGGPKTSVRVHFDVGGVADEPTAITVRAIVTP